MRLRWLVCLAIVVVGFLTAGAGFAFAAPLAVSASIARTTGRVDVLGKGETAWTAAVLGRQIADGDQVRAAGRSMAEISLPDGSTVLVAENTRLVVTKIAVNAETRQRDIALQVSAGKIRVHVVALPATVAGLSQFTISSLSGVAAVRGTIAVFAYNPATRQGLLFVLPSPGESAVSARVTYFNFATGTSTTVAGNQFITQAAGQLPSSPAPIASLPPVVQQQIQSAANVATANSPVLTAPTVTIVTPQQLQQALTAMNIQAVTAAPQTGSPPEPVPAPPLAPAPPLGRDTEVTSTQNETQSCATPPCS